MFKAIAHGKFRGLDGNQLKTDKASWSEIYQGAEDFETAAVFTRLSYLPPEHFWGILRKSFQPNSYDFPEYAGDLESIDFWPRYEDATGVGEWVEPDLLVRFTELDLIVEVKRGDGGNLQSASQLVREWEAVLNGEGGCDPERTHIFALGGLCEGFSHVLHAEVTKANQDIKLGACSWRKFAKVIRGYQIPANPTAGRILSDLIEIFAFHGHKEFLWVDDLAGKIRKEKWNIRSGSLNSLSNLHQKLLV